MATFFNPFLPGGNSIHTEGNLQLKFAGLFKYVWHFGTTWCENELKRSKDTYQNQSQNLFNISFGTSFSFSDVMLNTRFCWHGHCMKSDVFFNNFFTKSSKSGGTCRLWLYTYHVVFLSFLCFIFYFFNFLHVVNYESVKWEPFSADWLRRQNLRNLRVQVPWWNGKQMCVRCNFLFLFNIFSFDMGFSLEPLCHTKRHDKYIFTLATT